MVALDRDLLHEFAQALGVPRFDAVTQLPNESSVADSTNKYVLRVGRTRWILIISSAASPLIIRRAVHQQQAARAVLQATEAEAIELPFKDGLYGECSYAVWPMRQPVSSNRILFKLDKWRLGPRVYGWIRELAVQTSRPANPSTLAANAHRLCAVSALPTSIRQAADRAGNAFSSGSVPAIHILQHGDLWIGNVLKAPSTPGFVVIDWAGARLDGCPFFDLVKFAVSIGASKASLRKQIVAHSDVLRCRPEDAIAYVLSGLGQLNSVMEHFPESMFIELCKRKFDAVS